MWRSFTSDLAAGARHMAPDLLRAAARFGDALVSIGWGKFFLLALLALVLGSVLNGIFFNGGPEITVDPDDDRPVEVNVSVGKEGVRIAAAAPTAPDGTAPTAAADRTAPTEAAGTAPTEAASGTAPTAASGTTTAARGTAPTTAAGGTAPSTAAGGTAPTEGPASAPTEPSGVRIDDKGVRIAADDDGRKVVVSIDDRGVRVERNGRSGKRSERPRAEVVLPPEAVSDPEKAEQAVEAVRDKIEEIVEDEIDRQVARKTRVYRDRSTGSFTSLIVVLILASIMFKLILGSKKKAEVRAEAATATAAHEGLRRQLAEAHLKTMQAQVEPHFLFNTLASVDFLIETDPPRASKMQKNLIQYLRAALPQMREGSTTLGKEAALCRAYLEILKVRMEDRLHFAITVPQGLAAAQFPPMMLQSLVENAIRHGLEPKPEGGSLAISADISDGNLRVTVADTGLGFGAAANGGTGLGLSNVRERLAALYGDRAKLAVAANTPSGAIVSIEVPYRIGAEPPSGAPAAT
jgi:hypothetical protein